MGLRIGQNQGGGALELLRALQTNLEGLRENQSRIASGLRIRQASADPAGLVVSEQLRAQISTLGQAVENTQRGVNLISTAEGGLSQISAQLNELRGLAIQAANTATPTEARRVLQNRADSLLGSIDRQSATTRFGRENLLNGAQGFTLSNVPSQLTRVSVQRADVPAGGLQVDVQVSAQATRANSGAVGAQGAQTTVRITGERGSQEITVAAGATAAGVTGAINTVSEFTGVEVQGGSVVSSQFGSEAFVEIETLSGPGLAGITQGRTTGTDIQGNVNGEAALGDRNVLSTFGSRLGGEFTVDPAAGTGTFSFRVTGGGATLQVGGEPGPNDRFTFGIDTTSTGVLGGSSGSTLDSLRSGGANSILNRPQQAIGVIDAAINEISNQRGRLGSLVSDRLEPNVRSLGVALENLTASESALRDTNIAEAIAESTRQQLLVRAGLNTLAQANLTSQGVLRLLS